MTVDEWRLLEGMQPLPEPEPAAIPAALEPFTKPADEPAPVDELPTRSRPRALLR
jgi:hypothetical protein